MATKKTTNDKSKKTKSSVTEKPKKVTKKTETVKKTVEKTEKHRPRVGFFIFLQFVNFFVGLPILASVVFFFICMIFIAPKILIMWGQLTALSVGGQSRIMSMIMIVVSFISIVGLYFILFFLIRAFVLIFANYIIYNINLLKENKFKYIKIFSRNKNRRMLPLIVISALALLIGTAVGAFGLKNVNDYNGFVRYVNDDFFDFDDDVFDVKEYDFYFTTPNSNYNWNNGYNNNINNVNDISNVNNNIEAELGINEQEIYEEINNILTEMENEISNVSEDTILDIVDNDIDNGNNMINDENSLNVIMDENTTNTENSTSSNETSEIANNHFYSITETYDEINTITVNACADESYDLDLISNNSNYIRVTNANVNMENINWNLVLNPNCDNFQSPSYWRDINLTIGVNSTIDSIDLENSAIDITNITVSNLILNSDNLEIDINGSTIESLSAQSKNADISIENSTVNNIDIIGNNLDIDLDFVEWNWTINMEGNFSDMDFDNVYIPNVNATTFMGEFDYDNNDLSYNINLNTEGFQMEWSVR